jgi:hypothetical protein
MNITPLQSVRVGLVGLMLTFFVGCRTVEVGPILPPDGKQEAPLYVQEPEHAPIPQKKVPEGQSSLRY